jgi:hypothetical protein
MGRFRITAKGAAVVLTALALVVCIGLFVKQYQDAGPDGGGAGAAGPDPTTSVAPSDLPGPSPSTAPFFPARDADLPRTTLTPGQPPGIAFGTLTTHALVLTVTSAGRIPRLGYIVPTSQKSSYGDVKSPGAHWAMSTAVVGRPAYAAVFIQAGTQGTPITCRVSVDGATTSVKTTSGPYGRAVCIG